MRTFVHLCTPFTIILCLILFPEGSKAGYPFTIETFDNYGRQNNLGGTRPLNGWLPEDDRNAGNGIQSSWQRTTLNGDAVVAHLNDFQYLRAGGTANIYACDGLGGGTQLINGKSGVYANFKKLSVDFYPTDDDMVGLVWNYRRSGGDQVTPTPTTVPGTDANIRGYYLVFRNDAAGERCYGAYSSNKQVPTLFAKSLSTDNITYVQNTWNTLTVTKSDNIFTWNLFVPGIRNISGTFQDNTGSPLGAGNVGIVVSQMNGVFFDNFIVIDDPRCNDGLLNGEEEDIDCGAACGNTCSYPVTLTHSWATTGLTGFESQMYGATADAARWFVETDFKLWQRTNHGTDHTGGTNCINAWQGGHLIARHWGAMYDFDYEISFTNVDNDNVGITWRYIDPDNFFLAISNDEESCISIRKRVGGVDIQLPSLNQFGNGTTAIGTNGVTGKASPTSSTITTTWKIVANGNVFQWYVNNILFYTAVDPEPYVGIGAGYVGFFQQRTSGVAWNNPSVIVRSRFPSNTIARSWTTQWGTIGSRTYLPRIADSASGSFFSNPVPLSMHLDSALLFTRTTLRLWPDASGNGNNAFTYVTRASAAPPSVLRVPYEHTAVNFNGAQWLTAVPTQELNPLAKGITIFVAVKPTIAADSYILSLGYRGVLSNQMVGFRFAQQATFPPTVTIGAVGFQNLYSTNPQFFAPSADAILPLSFTNVNVYALRLSPSALFSDNIRPAYNMTVMTGRINDQQNISYSVLRLNQTYSPSVTIPLMDSPISLMGGAAYFQLGAAEDGVSRRFTGNIYDVVVYSGAVSDANMTAIMNSLTSKHGTTGCPSINSNLTGARILPFLSGTSIVSKCTGAVAGDRCELGCMTAAHVVTGGSSRLTCLDSGIWDNVQLSCNLACPTVSIDNAGRTGCSYGPSWDFSMDGSMGLQSTVPHYRRLSTYKDYSSSKWVASNGVLNVTGHVGSLIDLNMLSLVPSSFIETTASSLNITVRMASLSAGGGLVRLYFRSDSTGSNGYFVEFDLLRDRILLRRVAAGTASSLTCAGTRMSSLRYGSPILVNVMTFGTTSFTGITAGTIQVFLDGNLFCNVVDSTFLVGTVGLAVTGSTDASFDDFSVQTYDNKCTGCKMAAGFTCSMSCNAGFLPPSGLVGCAENGTLVNDFVCTMPPPLFNNQTFRVKELVPENTVVGKLNASSVVPGYSLLFRALTGNIGSAFTIEECSGMITVARPEMLDYEMQGTGLASFFIQIVASVSGFPTATTTAWLQIIVDDANDPPVIPTGVTLSIREDAAVNALVGAVTVYDPENNPWEMSIIYGNDDDIFALSPSGGLTIRTVNLLDFETKPSINLLIKVSEIGNPLSTSSSFITVQVLDANDAPKVVLPLGNSIFQFEIQARDVIAGKSVGLPFTAFDPDAGDSVSWSFTPISGSPLVFMLNPTTPQLIIALTRTFPSGSEYIMDNRLITDIQTLEVRATDSTGSFGTAIVKIYVLANVSTASPIVRAMTVNTMDSATGSGTFTISGGGFKHLLSTGGEDTVTLTIDNLPYSINNKVVANVTSMITGIGWVVDCSWTGNTNFSSALGTIAIDSVTCPTGGGWGTEYVWRLSLRRNSDNALLSNMIAGFLAVTDYAPPIIAQVLGEASNSLLMQTVGDEVIRIQGFNFGPTTATQFATGRQVSRPLIVTYGPSSDLYRYSASKFSPVGGLSNDNVRILFSSVPGAGINLQVSVSLAGQTVNGGPVNIVSYAAPSVSSVSVVSAVSPAARYYLSPEGGSETLMVTGKNFGPKALIAGTEPIAYYGPSIESFPLRFRTVCSQPNDAVTAHTTLYCPVVSGIGRNLTFIIVVADQQGDRSLAPLGEVSYAPSRVSSVIAPSGCDTRGNQVIYINGNFGPAYLSYGSDAPLVSYGPINAPDKYMALSCIMLGTTQTGQIQCLTNEGIGANLTVRAYVGGQWGVPGGSLSYAPPILSSFELDKVLSPGTSDANTLGMQDIIIYGSQFGPTMDSIVVEYYTFISDGNTRKLISYVTPVPCRKPTGIRAHTEMTCTTAAGAGRDLVWKITVGGQISSNPVTNYRAPVITAITMSDNISPVSGVSTDGGVIVNIQGNGFGPNVPPGPLLQKVIFGDAAVLDSASVYSPLTSTVISDGRIAMTLPPGIGQSLRVRVQVADVWSALSPANLVCTISYALPTVLSIDPVTGPTLPVTGSSTLRIKGLNFGLLDSSVDHYILFGNRKLLVTDRFPSLLSVQSGNLTTVELVSSNHYLETLLPEGVGSSIGIKVVAYRRDYPSLLSASLPVNDGSGTWFSFFSPSIINFGVESVTGGNMTNITFNCFGSTVDVGSVRIISLTGNNFGPSATAGAVAEILALDVNGVPLLNAVYSTSNICLISWTHSAIKLLTTNLQGQLRIRVSSTDPAGVLIAPQLSNAIIYMDVLPSINNIQGQPTMGYPTIGGPTLILEVGNLQGSSMVEIRVDNRTCPLVDDMDQLIPLSSIKTNVLDAQANARDPMIPLSRFIWTLKCRLPEGEGSRASIVVYRDNVPGTSVDVVVRYSSPTVDTVYTWDAVANAFVNVTNVNANGLLIRVPTPGTILKLTGNNFGICPIIVFGVNRGAACAKDKKVLTDTLIVISYSHNSLEVRIPEGYGSGTSLAAPNGYFLSIVAADQILPISTRYALPSLDTSLVTGPFSSSLKAPVSNIDLYPTVGGVTITIRGQNFGGLSAPIPEIDIILPQGNSMTTMAPRLVSCTNVIRDVVNPHTGLSCTLPEGSGKNLRLQLRVGESDQVSTSAPLFSYSAPRITKVHYGGPVLSGNVGSNFTTEMSASTLALIPPKPSVAGTGLAAGPTTGGYLINIDGSDFGPYEPMSGHCVSLSSALTTAIDCNGQLESWSEGEIASIYVVSWSHTNVTIVVPPGMGNKYVRIAARNQLNNPTGMESSSVFRYSSPVIFSMSPGKGSTEGYEELTLKGFNFGYGPTIYDNDVRADLSANPVPPKTIDFPIALPLPTWVYTTGLPTDQPMRVNFFTAARCVSSSVKSDNPVPEYSIDGCQRQILKHTHDTIVFLSLPGIGAKKNVSITLIDYDSTTISSNNVNFSYLAPQVLSADPSQLLISEPLKDEFGNFLASYYTFRVRGRYFGNPDTSNWTPEEQLVEVFVEGRPCMDAYRIQRGIEILIQCSNYGSPSGKLENVLNHIPTVGYKNITLRVAGQFSDPAGSDPTIPEFPLHIVCEKGYYGYPGERCLKCPRGAECRGYRPELETAVGAIIRTFTIPSSNSQTKFLSNVTECISCHTPPRALPGFFNMKGYLNNQGESESLCDTTRILEGKLPVTCEYIVACEPPESCLANNICAEGYANKAWPYRCSQCANGFYRSAGVCYRCPDSPVVNIIFFILFAILAIGLGYILNRKLINFAFLTIGLDYFQVISIFANTRVAWPEQLRRLFRILSAFNLNIELIAPECALPNVTFSQKWYAIMALPLAVILILLVLHTATTIGMKLRGQKGKFFDLEGSGSLIAMIFTLFYFLYLYLTRTIFEVLTCRSTDPPEFDKNGNEIQYMAGVFERCGVPNGVQERLVGPANAALFFYVILYPALVIYFLARNSELVMEDQLLRAKGVGDDKLTNPNAFVIRRTFGRLYYQFRPTTYLWIGMIILRKFLIALCALIFSQNQTFQLAAILMVLFLAYSAQTQWKPYMSPRDVDTVLNEHRTLAMQGDPLQLRLAANIKSVESRGRKRAFQNNFNAIAAKSRSTDHAFLSHFNFTKLAMKVFVVLINYNTVEAFLLASALLVALSGIMFSTAISTSAFYEASRDAVLASVLTLIAISIIYWLAVSIFELVTYALEVQNEKKVRTSKRASKMLLSPGSPKLSDDTGSLLIGHVESTSNPMFVTNSGNAKNADSFFSMESIQSLQSVPDAGVWVLFRDQYMNLLNENKALVTEVANLKRSANVSESNNMESSTEFSGMGDSNPSSPRNRRTFAPVVSAAENGRILNDVKSSSGLVALKTIRGKSGSGTSNKNMVDK